LLTLTVTVILIVIDNRLWIIAIVSVIMLLSLVSCIDVNEQIPIEMFAKRPAHKVKGHWIGTAVGKGHEEAQDTQHMPERVIILLCSWPVKGNGNRGRKKIVTTYIFVILMET